MRFVTAVSLWVPLLLALLLAQAARPGAWYGPAPEVAPTEAQRLAATFAPPLASGRGPTPFAGFGAQNPFLRRFVACYGRPWHELRHAGEDWFAAAGTDVRAVADGRVFSARDANYPGAVVIIEHTLAPGRRTPWDGDTLYSVYGHLDPVLTVRPGEEVRQGAVIGRVLDQDGGDHVHFELRRHGDLTGIQVCPETGYTDIEGRGYTAPDTDPTEVGYLNPSAWLRANRRVEMGD